MRFEFFIQGTPLSHQTRDRERLRVWREAVRAAAIRFWPPGQDPFVNSLQITAVYYHDGPTVRMDNDNLLKPIQDALNGLVYADDRQIVDTSVRKTELDGSFRVRGMSRILAEGFCQGREFLHVQITDPTDHRELLQPR